MLGFVFLADFQSCRSYCKHYLKHTRETKTKAARGRKGIILSLLAYTLTRTKVSYIIRLHDKHNSIEKTSS